jgi:hypothetical protein
MGFLSLKIVIDIATIATYVAESGRQRSRAHEIEKIGRGYLR